MAGQKNTKLKLLYLKEIFEKHSDEQHILNAGDIADRLLRDYGLECERKSVYKDIEVLMDYGMDIVKTRSPKNGFFLASGSFELAEIRLLSDAVQAADFITKNKTKKLIEKIEGFTSVYHAEVLKKQVYIDNRPKSGNESIYYVIDALDNAIKAGRKVKFSYSRRKMDDKYAARKETRTFTLSPYALIWSNDHYYLVANNEKYDNLMNVRVDRISGVSILEEKARPVSEVSGYKRYFDAADYAAKTFNMFTGEMQMVELRCSNAILEPIFDRFGERVNTRKYDDSHFLLRTEAAISEGLVSWIMQFGTDIEAIAPQNLRDMVIQRTESILNVYRKENRDE
ncbi:MAG: WYL domain-containing protein [Clostridia bacterium]|nr:WYL domain-containing protein [Clostridia bacterium]MBR5423696.1 WYL domain-containing protein [Clostridia bacterium]